MVVVTSLPSRLESNMFMVGHIYVSVYGVASRGVKDFTMYAAVSLLMTSVCNLQVPNMLQGLM